MSFLTAGTYCFSTYETDYVISTKMLTCNQKYCTHMRKTKSQGAAAPLTRAKPLFFGQKPAAKNEKNVFI